MAAPGRVSRRARLVPQAPEFPGRLFLQDLSEHPCAAFPDGLSSLSGHEPGFRKLRMDISVVLFEGFTTLDFTGPVEALQRIPEYSVRYFSLCGGPVGNGKGLAIETLPLAGARPGILLVPGGFGTRRLVNDSAFVSALRKAAEESVYCLTVCTGSALLAKTGLLDGMRATSNKRAFDWVVSVNPSVLWQRHARWVSDGKFYSSSGVSAGIDMALGFISDRSGEEKAREIADSMEYVRNSNPADDLFALD